MIEITSPAFKNGDKIPKRHTCDGENISPPLKISDVPEEAESLTLIVNDPDAPSGDFTHWILTDIDPKTTKIKEGWPPTEATEGINDSGEVGYMGPCPPSGNHRYFFKIYALDSQLDISEAPDRQEIDEAICDHIIDQGELTGRYSREI